MTQKRGRRMWIVKFAIKFLDIALILFTILFLINFYAAWKILRELRSAWNLYPSFVLFHFSFLAIVEVLLVSIIFLLHRGLGFIPRIESILERVLKGEYSLRITIRKADLLQSLVEKLNKILELLESNLKNK
jgi:methyl-accepting chemotaxis protein